MGVPTLEVGYTSATTGRGDQEVHKGHVVALGGGGDFQSLILHTSNFIRYICPSRLATGWTVRGSNPGGGEIFRTRSDRP
jgi:hypothetical protein